MLRGTSLRRAGLILLLAWEVLAGPAGPSALAGPPERILPVTARGNMLSVVEQAASTANPHVVPIPSPSYRVLSAEQCRCRAVQTQAMANMLDAEADELGKALEQRWCPPSQERIRQVALQQDLLHSNALELRNANAALQLMLFFRALESEALADLQTETSRLMAEAVERMAELRAKGLKSNEDLSILQRQQLDIEANGVRLQLVLDGLNAEMSRQLDLDQTTCQCQVRFWPLAPLHHCDQPLDCEAAVAEGLLRRPELNMLRNLQQNLDLKTLATLRKMLQGLNPLLGMKNSRMPALLSQLVACLCGSSAAADELEMRRAQLNAHLEERTRVISGEIREDVLTIHKRGEMIALLRQKVLNWQERVGEMQQKHQRGLVSILEMAEARLYELRARADLVKEVGNLERDWVNLHLHQGLLVVGCGH